MEQQTKTIDPAKMFAAIDVGTTKIVALVGYKDEKGNIAILGKSNVPSEGVWSGAVTHIATATQSIAQAIKEASEEAGFFPDKVVVGVAGKHIHTLPYGVQKNRENQDEAITEEEVEQWRNEARNICFGADEEIINIVAQNYVIDGQPFINPVGNSGRHIDANYQVVLGKINALTQLRKCVQNAGVSIIEDGLYLEPLASSDAVLSEDEKKRGVALIDMGGGTTDIAIFKNGALCHTEIVPFGGNLITKDIEQAFSISNTTAEEIKVKYGNAVRSNCTNQVLDLSNGYATPQSQIHVSSLAGVIQARVEEILDSAAYIIGTSGYIKGLEAGIVVTGGGSKLQNFEQLLSYKIPTLSTRKGYPVNKIVYSNAGFFNDPIYSTAIGLLMKSCKAWETINKVPEKIEVEPEAQETDAETKTKESKRPWWTVVTDKLKEKLTDIVTDEEY